MKSKQVAQFKRACSLLGVDPTAILLVGPKEWKKLTLRNVGVCLGRANTGTIQGNPTCPRAIYVNRNADYNTYVHEILHHLFLSWPHILIFQAADYLTREPGSTFTRVFGSRRLLIERAKRQARLTRIAV